MLGIAILFVMFIISTTVGYFFILNSKPLEYNSLGLPNLYIVLASAFVGLTSILSIFFILIDKLFWKKYEENFEFLKNILNASLLTFLVITSVIFWIMGFRENYYYYSLLGIYFVILFIRFLVRIA